MLVGMTQYQGEADNTGVRGNNQKHEVFEEGGDGT